MISDSFCKEMLSLLMRKMFSDVIIDRLEPESRQIVDIVVIFRLFS